MKRFEQVRVAEARRKQSQRRKQKTYDFVAIGWGLLKDTKLYVEYLRGRPVKLRDGTVVTREENEQIRRENWEAIHGKNYERPKC